MTLPEVFTRAREQAPNIVSARLALEEVRARLVGASLRFQANPELDGAVGTRHGSGDRSTDLELSVRQMFEPAGRRRARVAAANAAIEQSSAVVAEATRLVLRDAAVAFYRAVHASERIRLLAAGERLAAGIHAAADRRFKAGDIAVLDVNIARASLARVRADREAAAAAHDVAIGDLKAILGIQGELDVEGNLAPASEADSDRLFQAAAQRPELRQLEAAVREAEADVQFGRTFSKPEFGAGVRFEREDGDQVLLGGLTVTLPVFAKGQELQGAGFARASRLRSDLEAARARIRIEVESASRALGRRLAAVRVLETEALPGADENEQLTTRSFEVGQLGLAELLLIRREILDTRFQYLNALLDAALARIDLDATAGVLR